MKEFREAWYAETCAILDAEERSDDRAYRREIRGLAAGIVARVEAGEIDPRKAAVELGLSFDQDEIMAILRQAAGK